MTVRVREQRKAQYRRRKRVAVSSLRSSRIFIALESRVVVQPSTVTGETFAMGTGEFGQLGMGDEMLERARPGKIQFLDGKEIVAVAAGGASLTSFDEIWRRKFTALVHEWNVTRV